MIFILLLSLLCSCFKNNLSQSKNKALNAEMNAIVFDGVDFNDDESIRGLITKFLLNNKFAISALDEILQKLLEHKRLINRMSKLFGREEPTELDRKKRELSAQLG